MGGKRVSESVTKLRAASAIWWLWYFIKDEMIKDRFFLDYHMSYRKVENLLSSFQILVEFDLPC